MVCLASLCITAPLTFTQEFGMESPMQLEDHLGDIVRKARKGAGLSAAAAANAADLSIEEYREMEATGRGVARAARSGLAAQLGLNPERLAALDAGWRPAPRDLSQWRELRRITTIREGITVHCYLIWDEVSREAAVFDCGWDAGAVLAEVQAEQLTLKHLFLTHLHDDHIGGMAALRGAFPKLFLHSNSRHAPPQHRNRANDCLQLGSLRILNRETPGHAEEGVIYLVGNWPEDAPHVAMVGDTLFAGSVASGFQSLPLLRIKIQEQILTLPPDTLVCPGHGPVTTVGEERIANPFF
jgi:hydroxyacylglutathione hydrolase